MIPKIIHYTWFSDDPLPEKVNLCLNSWREKMPDYKFIRWGMKEVRDIDEPFLQESLLARKWAFASDFVRLYAVFNYGGIYLDTDVIVYKSFDDLLNNTAFIGRENSIHVEGRITSTYLTSHCFGAEKGNPFIGKCLSYYQKRHFIISQDNTLPMTLKYNVVIQPFVQSELARAAGYNPSASANQIQYLEDGTVVYTSDYFDCNKQTESSYCKHLALGAWRETKSKDAKITLKYKIQWRIERFFYIIANKFGYLLIKKQ